LLFSAGYIVLLSPLAGYNLHRHIGFTFENLIAQVRGASQDEHDRLHFQDRDTKIKADVLTLFSVECGPGSAVVAPSYYQRFERSIKILICMRSKLIYHQCLEEKLSGTYQLGQLDILAVR